MSQWHSFLSPAKLNLNLKIVGRREDGYHLLDSIFCLIDLYDKVDLSLTLDGTIARAYDHHDISIKDDLCLKAAYLLQNYTGCTKGVKIRLKKNIPIGGGLGGGSSNAATTLMALNRMWHTMLPREELMRLALSLGADVPFFLWGKAARVQGIGEILQEIELDEKNYLVVYPDIYISTPKVFSLYALTKEKHSDIISSVSNENDLQDIVVKEYPKAKKVFDVLSGYGYTRMSGSGSCFFVELNDSKTKKNALVKNLKKEKFKFFTVKTILNHPLTC
jgi:4-diphosphocytidyl-2-C-methyl-D-erythritol kinase